VPFVAAGMVAIAAVLLLAAPEDATRSFRLLVAALIVVGMVGFQLATVGAGRMNRAYAALAGQH